MPRTCGCRNPPETNAFTRMPPSQLLILPPLSGKLRRRHVQAGTRSGQLVVIRLSSNKTKYYIHQSINQSINRGLTYLFAPPAPLKYTGPPLSCMGHFHDDSTTTYIVLYNRISRVKIDCSETTRSSALRLRTSALNKSSY